MEDTKKTIKLFLYPILYWVILIIIPFIVGYISSNNNPKLNLGGVIMLYILFIAPFLFSFPYRLIKNKNKKEKILLILFGLIIPYIIIYIYMYIGLSRAIGNIGSW